MGLGPPVCCECRTLLTYNPKSKKNSEAWYCQKHGFIPDNKSSNLFCYKTEEIIEIEKRSYGYSITENRTFSPYGREAKVNELNDSDLEVLGAKPT